MASNLSKSEPVSQRFTTAVTSILYHSTLSGPSDKGAPLVILIHALMSSSRIWDSSISVLHSHGYRTLTYDLPGHGLTAVPQSLEPGSVTFDTICHDLHEIITTVVPEEVPSAIVGCSVGGILAIRYHMLYPPPPGRTTKIWSMEAPGLSTLPEAPEKWAARLRRWKDDGNNRNLAAETLTRWFPEPLSPQFDPEEAREIVESCTLHGYELLVWAVCHFDYTYELGTIKDGENVIIVAGENDTNIGPRSVLEDVSRRIEGSKYLLMAETGHIPPMHWPDRFEKLLLDFLAGDITNEIEREGDASQRNR